MLRSSAIAVQLSGCATLNSFESEFSASSGDHSAVLTRGLVPTAIHISSRLNIARREWLSLFSNSTVESDLPSNLARETARRDGDMGLEDTGTPDDGAGMYGTVMDLANSDRVLKNNCNSEMNRMGNHKAEVSATDIFPPSENDPRNTGWRLLSTLIADTIDVGTPQSNTLNAIRDKWYFDTSG